MGKLNTKYNFQKVKKFFTKKNAPQAPKSIASNPYYDATAFYVIGADSNSVSLTERILKKIVSERGANTKIYVQH
jgi:hypothetical protein